MMIYLASPYARHNQLVRLERFQKACAIRDYFLRKGISCFSPIAHNHNSRNVGDNWEFWQRFFDLDMLERCDVLVILKLIGWELSVGIQGELGFAQGREMPVLFMEEGNAVNGWENYV